MPTSERHLTPLLRRLKREIERERGFRCFAEQVSTEQVVMAYAAALGIDLLRNVARVVGNGSEAGNRTAQANAAAAIRG
jgi:hypothetical protein